MNGTNLFKIAFRALANNKLRAFLTMLGIIIGVASVIAMLAIGQGSKRSIQKQISEMGSNMIMIHPGAEMRGGVRQDPSSMQTLKLENYETLRDECMYLSAISPNVSASGQLISGSNNYPSSVSGVSIGYLTIRQLTVEQGEMFTEEDIRTAAKVCVIGKTIVDNLFPDGQEIEARVAAVKEDGKLDLSVRGKIPEQMDKDAELILECIETCGGKLPFTDKADPERIKAEMGMSKAAFKRAVGRLLKQKKIVIKEDGIYSL